MRKKIVLLLLFLALGMCIMLWEWRFSTPSARQIPPSVTFIGRVPGIGNPAGFYITNSGKDCILLSVFEVQYWEDGDWRTVSRSQVQVSESADPGKTNIHCGPVLEAGDYRSFAIKWLQPEEERWRLCIHYWREAKGFKDLMNKGKQAWKNHSLPRWREKTWTGPGEKMFSKEILNQDAE